MPRKPPARYRARTDGQPRRPWSSVNTRRGDKLRFDVVAAWRSLEAGGPLSQWDVFSMVLEGYLAHVEHELPAAVLEELARLDVDERAEERWLAEVTGRRS